MYVAGAPIIPSGTYSVSSHPEETLNLLNCGLKKIISDLSLWLKLSSKTQYISRYFPLLDLSSFPMDMHIGKMLSRNSQAITFRFTDIFSLLIKRSLPVMDHLQSSFSPVHFVSVQTHCFSSPLLALRGALMALFTKITV